MHTTVIGACAGGDSSRTNATSSPSFALASAIDRVGFVTPGERSFTVMVTVSLALAPPAVTVSSNVNSVRADTCGAVNVGVSVAAPVRVTAGLPAVCVQA